jgi:hypothetical protein
MSQLSALVERSRIYISAAPVNVMRRADIPLSEFQAMTWLEIEDPEFIDRIGDAGDAIARELRSEPFDRKLSIKAGRAAIITEPRFALAPWKPGQAALLAAEAGSENFGFRIQLGDAPAGGTPSERYFAATVGSAVEVYGAPSDRPTLTVQLWRNSAVVRVHAAVPNGG